MKNLFPLHGIAESFGLVSKSMTPKRECRSLLHPRRESDPEVLEDEDPDEFCPFLENGSGFAPGIGPVPRVGRNAPLPLREWAEVQESPWEVGELRFSRDFVFHWQYRIFEIEKELKDAPDDHKSFVHLQDDSY